ncbi:MAG: DNA repair protein RecN [Pseudomonadota bacterium]
MLTTLSIQNVVLIEQLTLSFGEGLCALTGETGAGKSILLDSLGLALGARADTGKIRKGADKLQVIASFDIEKNHIAHGILEAAGLASDLTLILRRSVDSNGRSKAYINDQPVSVGLLKTIGESLLEIHGQFETQGLLDPSTHRGMLDEYAGVGGALPALWDEWKGAEAALIVLKEKTAKAREEEQFLRQSIEDLDALEPKAGEEEELAGLRERLMNREQVLEALNNAYHVLNGEEDPVRAAWGALDRVSNKLGQEGEAIIDALSRASAEMQEAVSQIQSLSSDLAESEHSLESIDERLFTLRNQARKHGCSVDELAVKREEMAEALNMIEHGDQVLSDAIKAEEKAKVAFVKAAKEISAKRQAAAGKLDQLVAQELPPLKLEKARFVTAVTPQEDENTWGPHGLDQVRFMVATNPGADPGAMNKIASGGELSRFTLALKVVLAALGSAGSLIFDEIDAGIGGSTADAVGERLSRLSTSKQVLVVTHSPQVAARASAHMIVSKGGDEHVTTTVTTLQSRTERAEEIARMLSGAKVSAEAKAAAEKLMTGT